MGRNSDKVIRNFYKFDAKINKSTCIICGTSLTGSHVTNLKRHMLRKHAECLKDAEKNSQALREGPPRKKIKISYEVNKEDFISSILKIATEGGTLFTLFDSEGFREIVEPIYKGLSMAPISSQNIMDHIGTRKQSIVEEIKQLSESRLVALKIDVATRMGRTVLGVNLEIIETRGNKTKLVRTLGIIQLLQCHTGMYVTGKIIEILSEYNIGVEQIYSITTDNGANMTNSNDLHNADIQKESLASYDVMEMLDTISISNIRVLRCVAYTLQLCINDAHKEEDFNKNIDKARELCKLLHTDKYRPVLKQHNQDLPLLDVVTQWSSTYLMLSKLYDIREFVNKELNINNTDIDWNWLKLYIDGFQSVYDATVTLQQEHVLFTDFFKLLMELRLRCEKYPNDLTRILLTNLKAHESKLLENEDVLSAIYLDPRINLLLKGEKKLLAKENLKKIAYRLFKMKQAPVTETYPPEDAGKDNSKVLNMASPNGIKLELSETEPSEYHLQISEAEICVPENPVQDTSHDLNKAAPKGIKLECSEIESSEYHLHIPEAEIIVPENLAQITSHDLNLSSSNGIKLESTEAKPLLVEVYVADNPAIDTSCDVNTGQRNAIKLECVETEPSSYHPQVPTSETYAPENSAQDTSCNTENSNSLTPSQRLTAYLESLEQFEETNSDDTITEQLDKIYADIDNFKLCYGRIPIHSNILEFFGNLKYKSPHLFELALVVFATPATQLSVKRSISALNFILSAERNSMDTETLNTLLIVKLNS